MPEYMESIQRYFYYFDNLNVENLILSRLFFRELYCPANCGACCFKVSLDYFEGQRWERFKKLYPENLMYFVKRKVKDITLYSDLQSGNKTRYCRYLNLTNGRCKIHLAHPFLCDFELNKIIKVKQKTYILKRLHGRGWNYRLINGRKGAKCKLIDYYDKKMLKKDINFLQELLGISKKFGYRLENFESVISYLEKLKSFSILTFYPEKNVLFTKKGEK